MTFDQIILGFDIISLLLLLATLVFMVKNREFERMEVENSMNALIFGVFFLFLAMLINVIIYLDKSFQGIFAPLGDIATYMNYLITVTDIALIPLFAVCFFVGIFLARDYLSEFPKTVKKEEDKIKIK